MVGYNPGPDIHMYIEANRAHVPDASFRGANTKILTLLNAKRERNFCPSYKKKSKFQSGTAKDKIGLKPFQFSELRPEEGQESHNKNKLLSNYKSKDHSLPNTDSSPSFFVSRL